MVEEVESGFVRSSVSGMHSSLRPPVVVIGAGASGLAAIKACLEEKLDVVCYEMTDAIGGLWRYRKSCPDGLASVMKTTVINTSKEMSAFSDFPPPDHFPNFMHNKYFAAYLDAYAQHFRLLPYVRLRHRINKVAKRNDHASSQEWNVTVLNVESGKELVHAASGVIVCVGHHAFPNEPDFAGLRDAFRGRVLHSRDCRSAAGFEDQRVLVVGLGNSGGDVAVELSRVADRVFLSTRRGAWVMPRMGDAGQPIDLQYGRRVVATLMSLLPDSLKNLHAEYKLNCRYDHSAFDLRPEHRFFSQHPLVNDDLPGRLLSGSVILREDVDHFTSDGVVFRNGDAESLDVVVLATGYHIRFPFLDDDVLYVRRNLVDLYRHVFPVDAANLSFVGLVQPFGPLPPISELQARWVARVLSRRCSLPCRRRMEMEVGRERSRKERRYVPSPRHTLEVDALPYMDDVATELGVRPPLAKLLFTDPVLFAACWLGPAVPYQYRLHGPHCAPRLARRHIVDVQRRVSSPLITRRHRSELAPESTLRDDCDVAEIHLGSTFTLKAGLMALLMLLFSAFAIFTFGPDSYSI